MVPPRLLRQQQHAGQGSRTLCLPSCRHELDRWGPPNRQAPQPCPSRSCCSNALKNCVPPVGLVSVAPDQHQVPVRQAGPVGDPPCPQPWHRGVTVPVGCTSAPAPVPCLLCLGACPCFTCCASCTCRYFVPEAAACRLTGMGLVRCRHAHTGRLLVCRTALSNVRNVVSIVQTVRKMAYAKYVIAVLCVAGRHGFAASGPH